MPDEVAHKEYLEGLLGSEHSKSQTMFLVAWVGADAKRLAILMQVFFGDDPVLAQRCAWVIRYIGEAQPKLMQAWMPEVLQLLKKPGIHHAVRRNVLHVFDGIEYPRDLDGLLADFCFNYLADPNMPTAIRAFSINILEKIGEDIPEILPELYLLLEDHMEHGSAGFKSKARKVLGKRRIAP